MKPGMEALSGVRLFANGVMWNAIGRILPIFVALLTTPLLLHRLGVNRWGLFTLALSLAGSFGMLDLGISAALTRALAERIGTDEEHDAAPLITTSLAVLVFTGLAGAVAGWAVSPIFVDRLLNVPPHLRSEAVAGFRMLAASVPLIIANAALWGVLSAYQRFRLVNIANIPINAMYYVGPLLSLLVWNSLVGVILALVLVRLTQTMVYAVLAAGLVPALRAWPRFEPRLLGELMRIGGWIAVSNTLWPIMIYIDRFIVGAMLPLAAVSHYATPLDLVGRFGILPMAVSVALFPAVATTYRAQPERTRSLLRAGSLAIVFMVLPACLLVVGFSRELLTLWLGADFAASSHRVLTILGVGVFFSCMSYLPGTLLDATGRPKVGALFLLGEAGLFPPVAVVLILAFGVDGAAMAWALRAAMSCVGRYYLCARLVRSVAATAHVLVGIAFAGGAALVICALLGAPLLRVAAVVLFALALPCLAAAALLERHEILRLRQAASAWLSASPLGWPVRRA